MTGWNGARARALTRDGQGRFLHWKTPKGEKKDTSRNDKTGNNFHGIKTHIGKEYER